MQSYRRTFPGLPEEIRTARHWARGVLGASHHAEDAALIVAELGANAVLHTASGEIAGTFDVTLTVCGPSVTVAVSDHGCAQTIPHVEHPSEDNPHGRGLGIVNALAAHVEVCGDDTGRTIAAHLTADEEVS